MGPLLPCQWVGWLLPVPVAFTRACARVLARAAGAWHQRPGTKRRAPAWTARLSD